MSIRQSWSLIKPVAQPAEVKTENKALDKVPVRAQASRKRWAVSTRKAKRTRKSTPNLPPELSSVITIHHVYRWSNSSAAAPSSSITAGNIAAALGGVITVSGTTIQALASTFRIHSVTIWPTVQSVTSPEIIWVSPSTAIEKDESKIRSIPAGVTVDRPVFSRPPTSTLCGSWINAGIVGGQSLFTLLNIPQGSVVDMDITWTLANNVAAVSAATTTTGLGSIVHLPLDGHTGGKFIAQGLPVAV